MGLCGTVQKTKQSFATEDSGSVYELIISYDTMKISYYFLENTLRYSCSGMCTSMRGPESPRLLRGGEAPGRGVQEAVKTSVKQLASPLDSKILETDSASPVQAKRHCVKDAIKNYRPDYRRRGPRRAPGNTTSTHELRQANPGLALRRCPRPR